MYDLLGYVGIKQVQQKTNIYQVIQSDLFTP